LNAEKEDCPNNYENTNRAGEDGGDYFHHVRLAHDLFGLLLFGFTKESKFFVERDRGRNFILQFEVEPGGAIGAEVGGDFGHQFIGGIIEADSSPEGRGELIPDADEAVILSNGTNAVPKHAAERVGLTKIFKSFAVKTTFLRRNLKPNSTY